MAEGIAVRLDGTWGGRPEGALPDTLPVVLRSATHARIGRGRFSPSWSKRFVLVKWVVKGEAAMRVGGRRIPMRPGEVSVYIPTVPHEYWAVAEVSEICWFSIDGPLSEAFVHHLGLRPGVYGYEGAPPVAEIRAMVEALKDQSLDGRLRGSELAIRQLYEVARRVPRPAVTNVEQQVRHLIQEGLAEPGLSAKGIAAKLSYNRSALSQTFRRQAGMTIIQCITETRLKEAEMLLGQTEDRIGDVAKKCGFADVSYFSRWVRKHTGKLPKEMRGVG